MDRDIEHFEGRLEKDNYSKDEVAKMLHNEADFTATKTRKEFDGFVSREDFDSMSTELDTVKGELKPYKKNDFNNVVKGEFSKLNGFDERVGDFTKLANLTGEESQEEVAVKVAEFKEDDKYSFMFSKEDSGGSKDKHNLNHKPKTPLKGAITPKIGSFNLFNRKK